MNDIKIKDLTKNIISAIRQSINVEKAGLHEPSIDDMDIKSVVRTLETGFVSSVGKDIEEFEKDIARYTNASYVVGMCNGTSALHISLLANNIRENDEILVPALTFIATEYNGMIYCTPFK